MSDGNKKPNNGKSNGVKTSTAITTTAALARFLAGLDRFSISGCTTVFMDVPPKLVLLGHHRCPHGRQVLA
jgi:hypothetical protein